MNLLLHLIIHCGGFNTDIFIEIYYVKQQIRFDLSTCYIMTTYKDTF